MQRDPTVHNPSFRGWSRIVAPVQDDLVLANDRHLQANPAREIDLPTLRCVRPKWALTTAQAAALLDALAALPKTMAGLAILTGLRRGELFALRWQDLDLAERSLTVREAVYEGIFGTPKTEPGPPRRPRSVAAPSAIGALQGAL